MISLPGMGARLRELVLGDTVPMRRARGAVIVAPGSLPNGMHVVDQGLGGLFAAFGEGAALVAPVMAGVVFETRLDRDVPGSRDIRALTNMTFLHLPENRFRNMLEDDEFRTWCSANQRRNFDMLSRINAATNRRNADQKILSFVETYLELYHVRPLGEREEAEWLFTQSQFAEIVGLTRTHLNARLAILSENGKLDIRRKKLSWSRESQAVPKRD